MIRVAPEGLVVVLNGPVIRAFGRVDIAPAVIAVALGRPLLPLPLPLGRLGTLGCLPLPLGRLGTLGCLPLALPLLPQFRKPRLNHGPVVT